MVALRQGGGRLACARRFPQGRTARHVLVLVARASSDLMQLPRFTLLGATTRMGLLSSPLLDRFGFHWQLRYYELADMTAIVKRSASLIGVPIDSDGANDRVLVAGSTQDPEELAAVTVPSFLNAGRSDGIFAASHLPGCSSSWLRATGVGSVSSGGARSASLPSAGPAWPRACHPRWRK